MCVYTRDTFCSVYEARRILASSCGAEHPIKKAELPRAITQ